MLALNAHDQLPHAPASDVKKLGWRGLMKQVRSGGKLVVTNHNEPEAVILSIAEYEAIARSLRDSHLTTETRLGTLRMDFDARLASLSAADAGDRLRALIQQPVALNGAVKAGASD